VWGKVEKHRRKRAHEDRVKNPVGGEAKDPRERKGRDGCVAPIGRSHQGGPEAEDTLTTIFHGVEISIAGGGADEKDEENRGLFFFFFLFYFMFIFYMIYSLLRYKKSHGALAMVKTKPKIQNKQTKETSGTENCSTGVRTGPRPTYGREIKPRTSRKTLPIPADSMKNITHKPGSPETT